MLNGKSLDTKKTCQMSNNIVNGQHVSFNRRFGKVTERIRNNLNEDCAFDLDFAMSNIEQFAIIISKWYNHETLDLMYVNF